MNWREKRKIKRLKRRLKRRPKRNSKTNRETPIMTRRRALSLLGGTLSLTMVGVKRLEGDFPLSTTTGLANTGAYKRDLNDELKTLSEIVTQNTGINCDFDIVIWQGIPKYDFGCDSLGKMIKGTYPEGKYMSIVNTNPEEHICKFIMDNDTLISVIEEQHKDYVIDYGSVHGARIPFFTDGSMALVKQTEQCSRISHYGELAQYIGNRNQTSNGDDHIMHVIRRKVQRAPNCAGNLVPRGSPGLIGPLKVKVETQGKYLYLEYAIGRYCDADTPEFDTFENSLIANYRKMLTVHMTPTEIQQGMSISENRLYETGNETDTEFDNSIKLSLQLTKLTLYHGKPILRKYKNYDFGEEFEFRA